MKVKNIEEKKLINKFIKQVFPIVNNSKKKQKYVTNKKKKRKKEKRV